MHQDVDARDRRGMTERVVLGGLAPPPYRHMRRNRAPISTGSRGRAARASVAPASGQARLSKCCRIAAGVNRGQDAYMWRGPPPPRRGGEKRRGPAGRGGGLGGGNPHGRRRRPPPLPPPAPG